MGGKNFGSKLIKHDDKAGEQILNLPIRMTTSFVDFTDSKHPFPLRVISAADYVLARLGEFARIVEEIQEDAGENRRMIERRQNSHRANPGRTQVVRLKATMRKAMRPASDVLLAAAQDWGIASETLVLFMADPRINLRSIRQSVSVITKIRIEGARLHILGTKPTIPRFAAKPRPLQIILSGVRENRAYSSPKIAW